MELEKLRGIIKNDTETKVEHKSLEFFKSIFKSFNPENFLVKIDMEDYLNPFFSPFYKPFGEEIDWPDACHYIKKQDQPERNR